MQQQRGNVSLNLFTVQCCMSLNYHKLLRQLSSFLPQSAFSKRVAETFAPHIFPRESLLHGDQRYGRGSPVSLFVVLSSTKRKLQVIKWSQNDLRWLIFLLYMNLAPPFTVTSTPWPTAPLCLLQPVTPPCPQSESTPSGSWRRRCNALCFLLKTRFAYI